MAVFRPGKRVIGHGISRDCTGNSVRLREAALCGPTALSDAACSLAWLCAASGQYPGNLPAPWLGAPAASGRVCLYPLPPRYMSLRETAAAFAFRLSFRWLHLARPCCTAWVASLPRPMQRPLLLVSKAIGGGRAQAAVGRDTVASVLGITVLKRAIGQRLLVKSARAKEEPRDLRTRYGGRTSRAWASDFCSALVLRFGKFRRYKAAYIAS